MHVHGQSRWRASWTVTAFHLTPGISGALGPLMIKGKLIARPLHAVVRWRSPQQIFVALTPRLRKLRTQLEPVLDGFTLTVQSLIFNPLWYEHAERADAARASSHVRHSPARAGRPRTRIMALLGHSSVRMIAGYSHASPEAMCVASRRLEGRGGVPEFSLRQKSADRRAEAQTGQGAMELSG